MGKLNFAETPLAGAYVIDLDPHGDERGHFVRTLCADTFHRQGLASAFPQANQSWTRKEGSVRGLHFRPPPVGEVKVIRCTRGAAWDVIVDLRLGSPTFLKWHAVELRE